ncbi:cupin domain-containing protein [Streptomyces sp. ME03-5684b]|uniref:Cupin domain-containing protein n=1 Tax=Streptomyces violaceolatus TaxID=67378 RepID=A0ABN3SZ74_9ACTN|nr:MULTISPECIES: cupin domain-containing protein [Streptomyces]MDX3320039.1 cupin domain-containing protein [Streptomyces sp. ME03-5684b]GHA51456.1 cupin [Streptomyces anthocyanicus]
MSDEPRNSKNAEHGEHGEHGEAGADPAVSVVGPGDGETILLGTTRMRVLEDGSHTGHRLGMAESVLAPHTPGPPQHRHARHDEGFYVISGTVRFTVGDEDIDATAGTLVMVPPGAPHTFANTTGEPARMLSTFTPDLYVQYFRDLEELYAGGRTPTPEESRKTMSRYATEPATGSAGPRGTRS